MSLLGDASLIGTDVRSWLGVELTYCIFGQKISNWNSWTLVQPLHMWVEPPGKPNWGRARELGVDGAGQYAP